MAMTRAKKRLYVPIKKKRHPKKISPMDLFSSQVERDEGSFIPYLEKLSKSFAISYEEIPSHFVLPLSNREEKKREEKEMMLSLEYTPSYIQSFTSLAREQKIELPDLDPNIPARGCDSKSKKYKF